MRYGLIQDRVRILAGVNLPAHLQSLWIEHRHIIRTTVARESLAKVRRNGDAMHARRLCNHSGLFTLGKVDHLSLIRMRSVQTLRGAIDVDVVPSARTANLDLADHFIF